MSEQFNRLLEQKRNEQLATVTDSLTNVVYRQRIVPNQLESEKKYYSDLSDSDKIVITSSDQSQLLTPRIETEGMSKKSINKLKKRSLENYKRAQKIVGDEYATVQTVPLMLSIKKNAESVKEKTEKMMDATEKLDKIRDLKDVAKERQELEKKEKERIIELSNLQLPQDLFDVDITKKHSHFDVKRALAIKEKLNIIEKYKAGHYKEYEVLDFDVYVRLELLLDQKRMFEQTLETVLAANGVSLEGEKVDSEKIRKAREDYYPVKDAYREVVASGGTLFEEKKRAVREERERDVRLPGEFFSERDRVLKDIVQNKWSSYSAEPIPAGYLTSTFYRRVVYRIVPGDEQESFRRIQLSIDCWRLSDQSLQGEERDAVFERAKPQIRLIYSSYKEKYKSMLERVNGKSMAEINAMLPEFLEFVMPGMHVSDMMKQTNSKGESFFRALGDKDEGDQLSKFKTDLDNIRLCVVTVNAYRAANAGIVLKQSEYDQSMDKIAGKALNPDGTVDLERFRKEIADVYKNKTDSDVGFDSYAFSFVGNMEKFRKKISDHQDKVRHIREREEQYKQDRETDCSRMQEYMETHPEAVAYKQQEVLDSEREEKNLTRLWSLFRRTGIRLKDDEDPLKTKTFQQMLRELYGVSVPKGDYLNGPLVERITQKDFTLESMIELLEHYEDEDADKYIMQFCEKNLFSVDLESVFEGFDLKTLENPEKRIKKIDSTLNKLHKILAFKQWAEESKMSDKLKEDDKKKLMTFIDKFEFVSGKLLGLMRNPDPTFSPKEFLEVDVPAMKQVFAANERQFELKETAEQGAVLFHQKHPLREVTASDFNGLHQLNKLVGSTSAGKETPKMPVTEEELGKLRAVEPDFIRQLAKEVQGFSFINEFDRARVFDTPDVKELLNYGTEDYAYYCEMAWNANMLLAAKNKDEKAVRRILGDDADKIFKECERIEAIREYVRDKLESPGMFESMRRYLFRSSCEEAPEDVALEHDKQASEVLEERIRQQTALYH